MTVVTNARMVPATTMCAPSRRSAIFAQVVSFEAHKTSSSSLQDCLSLGGIRNCSAL